MKDYYWIILFTMVIALFFFCMSQQEDRQEAYQRCNLVAQDTCGYDNVLSYSAWFTTGERLRVCRSECVCNSFSGDLCIEYSEAAIRFNYK